MAVLRTGFCAVLVGCYSPDLPDCRVPCTADVDCAPDQTCGAHKMCAAPMMTCPGNDETVIDGPGTDAPVAIDAPTDDGPALGILTVKIMDQGAVHVSGAGTCDSVTAVHDQCSFGVELGVQLTLHAIPHEDRRFEKWTEGCIGNDPTCQLTPTAAQTMVQAKFRKDD